MTIPMAAPISGGLRNCHIKSSSVCNHCGNKGHYQRLCRSRLEGRPPKSSAAVRATDTSSSATASSSSSSSDSEARDAALAALKDQLELIQKQISGFT